MKTILHVDDDEDIREITRFALTEISELSVTQCSSGPDALAVLEELKPDLILLDAIMPEMSGEETFARIRRRPDAAHIPVVFMTARSEESVKKELLGLGADAVIVKPFDPFTLASELEAIWTKEASRQG